MALAARGVTPVVRPRPLLRLRRGRGHALQTTATLNYTADQLAEPFRRRQQAQLQQGGDVTARTGQRHTGPAAEELQRHVDQLQSDNAELQAEIQQLAATLKAALASSPSGAVSDWQQQELPPQPHQQLQPVDKDEIAAYHEYGHLEHVGAGRRSSNGSTLEAASGSMLAPGEAANGGSPMAPPQYHPPAGVSQATLSCSMQHPGSICCSKLSSTVDPGGAACTVSLHTTARCTADDSTVHRHLSPQELQALAAHALISAAHTFSHAATAEYRASSGPPADVAATHADLTRVLEQGVVMCAEHTPPSQFGHKSYLLTLQDPQTSLRVRAIYKPRVYGDASGWHRTPMEWVAYRLSLLLGLDYVPPTAYRTAPLSLNFSEEDEEVVYPEGAMMLWVENSQLLKEFAPHRWGVEQELLLSDTRILDVLLHNSDRHHGHFLLGPHWALGRQGDGRWEGAMRPVLIDHAAAFRKEAVVSMEHENAFGTGAVRCVSASTYLRLRFLDAQTIADELGQHLSRSEQRQLLHRRDYVLHYFDGLVATQGYAATVRE